VTERNSLLFGFSFVFQMVAAMVSSVLKRLKILVPFIANAILQSDRAGPYRNWDLMNLYSQMGRFTGINVIEKNFTGAGNGKSELDAHFAYVDKSLKSFVDEGHDIQTASDVVAALNHKKLSSSFSSLVQVRRPALTIAFDPRFSIQSVGSVKFLYQPNSNTVCKVWTAFGIGNGKKIVFPSSISTLEDPAISFQSGDLITPKLREVPFDKHSRVSRESKKAEKTRARVLKETEEEGRI
jgi:hypothetical protein